MDIQDVFDPVLCSNADCAFLLLHLGEPVVVARKFLAPPVTAATVMPIIARVNELDALKKAEGQEWVGVEALKVAITKWLTINAKWAYDHAHKRGAPRFPSLYSFDAKGKAHLGGPGSDSGRVRTYFGPNGERVPFAINLLPDTQVPWEGPTAGEELKGSALYDDPAASRIECRIKKANGDICGHTESYNSGSRSSYNAARARMSKHLRKATEEVDAHMEIHTAEFGGSDAN